MRGMKRNQSKLTQDCLNYLYHYYYYIILVVINVIFCAPELVKFNIRDAIILYRSCKYNCIYKEMFSLELQRLKIICKFFLISREIIQGQKAQ